MRFEWVSSKDTAALAEWDSFLCESPRGHYCQLSTWLKSFSSYGFDFGVLVARATPGGPIAGGMGLLLFRNPVCRVMAAPVGPILDTGFEDAFAPLVEETLSRARRGGVSLVQLQFPCPAEPADLPALLPSISLPSHPASRAGLSFKTGNAPNQMLWVEFPPDADAGAWREQLLKRFNTNTRRNILFAERQGLEVAEAETEAELREAYALIERNGREQGYATRAWKDFGPTLVEQVRRRHAVVLVARRDGRALGVHYGVVAGRRYSYMMGGTLRTDPDLKVGHLLHWAAMNKARGLGLLGYDLTSGGSPGVMRFKMGFRPQHIRFIEPRHFALSSVRYSAFNLIYPRLRRHKQLVSKFLSAASGALGRR